MRSLFDTDHISILQRKRVADYSSILSHAAPYSAGDFAFSIVSFDEQTRGAHASINAARRPEEIIAGYGLLELALNAYGSMAVLPFDRAAVDVFDRLRSQRVRIGTMDLRIASIALAQGLVVLTRNTRDFGMVPGLTTEDWTV
jgi:tRNA(fMet)-specific endonuclease VapC